MKIKLITPFVDMAKETRTCVDLREVMTGGDLLFARRESSTKDPVEVSFRLVARMIGLDMSELESMDIRDIEVLQGKIEEIQSKKADATP